MPLADWATYPRRTSGFKAGFGPLRYPGGDLRDWAHNTVEKIRVASIGGRFRFLPYYDPYTEETPEIRREYPRMLVESTIKAAFQTKVLSVISLPIQFNAPDDDDPRQAEAADFCRWVFKHLKGGASGAGWSVLHPSLIKGLSVCEKVRPAEPIPSGKFRGKRPIVSLKSKDTDFLQVGIDAFRNPEVVRGMAYNAGRSWPVEDFVLFTYMSLFENPSGMSDFRAAYPDYWRKKTVWELRQLHLDKFTGPYLVGKYTGQDQKNALEAALTDARATTWMTLPMGAMVDAIDLSMRGTEDYEKAIKDCDRGMLIAIVGAHLQILEGQTTGGRGNTKVHKETAELIQWWLADRLAQTYYEQIAIPLTAENYWDVEAPEVSVGAVTEEEVLKSLEVYEKMQKLGAKISSREVYKVAGKTKPTEADDVLTPAQPPQQPPAPAGGGPGGANPFSQRVRRFCQEGENKGLPGVCPEHRATDAHKDALSAHSKGVKAKLGGDERGALDDYVAGLDEPVNDALRSGREITDRDEKAIVKGLDSIFAKTPPLAEPVNVHRGVRLGSPEKLQAFLADARAKSGSGRPLTFNAYSSTTTDPAVADKFLRGKADTGVIFDIEASHGVSVGELTVVKQGQSEAEFLMPRGSDFDVLGVEDGGPGVPARVRLRQRAGARKSSERVAFADGSCVPWFARRFCQEGENKGMPGVCPEGKPSPAGKGETGRQFERRVGGHVDLRPADPAYHDPVRLQAEQTLAGALGDRSLGMTFRPASGVTVLWKRNRWSGAEEHAAAVAPGGPGRVVVFNGAAEAAITRDTPPDEAAYKVRRVLGLKVDAEMQAKFGHVDPRKHRRAALGLPAKSAQSEGGG